MTELHDRALATCSICRVLSPDEKDVALLRRVVDEIWNAGNIDLADELFSSAYVNHGGLIPDVVKGPEGVKFSVALYRAAFPGLQIRVDTLSSTKGTVSLRWTAHSTFAQHGPGATGASLIESELSGAIRSSVAGGLIVESWTSWDSTAALRRLEVFQANHEETS